MNSLLEKHFDIAFAAPDGIKKLRELILTLAMQGKLVPQDVNDQPASELFKEIGTKKRQLVKDGKIKTIEQFTEIKIEDQAHLLPSGWIWVRLGEISIKIGSGSTPRGGKSAYESEGIPFLRSQNIWNDGLRLNDVAFISAKTHKSMSGTKVAPVDILLNITGASLGRCALVQNDFEEANVSQHVTIIRTTNPDLRRYVHQLLLSPYCQKMIWTRQVGMAREGLSKKVLEQFEIPLPPLAEQRRIVAKIDELMVRCDELEKLRKQREQKRLTVHTAAIRQLLADSVLSFASPRLRVSDFLFNHFSELYSVKENVAELRKAILQLAVMGKLVQQDPSDQPAAELLKEIEAEKQKSGLTRRREDAKKIKPEEVPYQVPVGWEWVRLGEIVSLLGDGLHGTPNYDETGSFFFINGNNLSNGVIEIKENTKKVSYLEFDKYKKELTDRTVLVSINGTIGNVAFYNQEQVVLGKSACYFNLFNQIEKQYIKKIINSSYFLGYALQSATGSTIKNVSLKAMREFCVPLPPLAEQHRIVTKIDQLMALCDEMDKQIEASNQKQTAILNAVMSQVSG